MPRLLPDATAAQATNTTACLRMLEANVLQKKQRPALLLVRVAQQRPDLVLALETDPRWVNALRPLRRQYPYIIGPARPNPYGMVLYSCLPLLEARVYNFQEPDIPTPITDVRLPNGRLVRLYAVHPTPSWSSATRPFEASGELPNVRRGMYSTFDAKSGVLRWPLDHLFATRGFRVLGLARLPAIGSDHFPMLFEVVLAE